MNDTVATESQGHPANVTSLKARRNDRDLGSRNSSGPAVIMPAPKGRTYDRCRPARSHYKKALANRGRPHMTVRHTFAISAHVVARGTKKTRRDCSRRVPTFVSRWSRRRERPVAKPQEKPSGRSQRGDSAWNKTLDHLLSLCWWNLSIGTDSARVKGRGVIAALAGTVAVCRIWRSLDG
jgi:hypothetical protein